MATGFRGCELVVGYETRSNGMGKAGSAGEQETEKIMAKRPLKSFSVEVVGNTVEVEIETDRQKPYRYQICPDERHPKVQEIARHLKDGLREAKETYSKIEIVEYLERSYVTIGLPIAYHSNQYTAHKL